MNPRPFICQVAEMMGIDRKLPAWATLPANAKELELLLACYCRPMIEDARADTEYGRYLESGMWRWRRTVVMVLARGKCAECPERAEQVHHLTYARRGREWLSDLLPVCKLCHDAKHNDHFTKAADAIHRRLVRCGRGVA